MNPESSDAEELRGRLSPEQYAVTQEGATEPAFTGCYWDCKEAGVYRCVCCDAALFDSSSKYDSGSGWPSFYQAVQEGCVAERQDESHGMLRVEILCQACGAHLGHVFPDGPQPTGRRFCVNSASLNLDRSADRTKDS